MIEMVRRAFLTLGFCLFLLSPISSWALDANDNWRDLSPREKDKVLQNYRRWQNLSPQGKERLREEWDRWQRLPQERRDRLKRRYEEERRKRSDD